MATAAAPTYTPSQLGFKLRDAATHRGPKRIRLGSGRGGQLASGVPGGKSLDAAKIEAAYVGYHKTFHDRLKVAESIARRFATVVQTDNLLDVQVWLSQNPKMRRWQGDKVLHKYRGEAKNVRTFLHEASVQVPKQDLINDRLGMYRPRIAGMADAYGWALDDLFCGYLAAGVAGTALGTTYDGQNLIDTDHTALSVGGASQSNKVTGAFTSTVYNDAWERYLNMKDENGNPVNVAGRRMVLLHGPSNREAVRDVLDPETTAAGATNLDQGTAIPVCTPWLSARTVEINGIAVTITGTEWFLLPEDSAAVLIHEKQLPEFMSVEEGEFVFRTGNHLYGIEAEFGGEYGMWQEIVGGPGA